VVGLPATERFLNSEKLFNHSKYVRLGLRAPGEGLRPRSIAGGVKQSKLVGVAAMLSVIDNYGA